MFEPCGFISAPASRSPARKGLFSLPKQTGLAAEGGAVAAPGGAEASPLHQLPDLRLHFLRRANVREHPGGDLYLRNGLLEATG
jgi:hypothetical protein